MVVDYRSTIFYLEQIGLVDVFLPFILIFTILFAILQKIEIFKTGNKPNKRINGIISFSVALLIVIPHVTGTYPPGQDVVEIINSILPGAVVLIIAIFVLLLLLGLVGAPEKSPLVGIAALVAIVGLVAILWNAFYPYSTPPWLYWLQDPSLQAVLIMLLLFGLVAYFIGKEEKTSLDLLEGIKKLIFGSKP